MKLIPCPACEHRVSSEAPFCPACGHPVAMSVAQPPAALGKSPRTGEICHDCSAPATQKCADCGVFCCVSHSELMSSKYDTGFYCATCAEARAESENTAMIIGLIVAVLFIIGLLASAAAN